MDEMPAITNTPSTLDVARIRADFPALSQSVNGAPLVYLDNAATTHKPVAVINAICSFYERDNSNVHRGVHTLSQRATDSYEAARETARGFIGASDAREIIFTSGTTDAINLVANSMAQHSLLAGGEILLTEMEHHSNIVPWQLVAERTGATVRFAPVSASGEIIREEFSRMLNRNTRVVSFVHTSNSLGTVNAVNDIIEECRTTDAIIVVDGAQAAQHGQVNVTDMDCDFFCLSAHKIYGPTGFGVLYGKSRWLDDFPPFKGGGDMIETVRTSGSTFAKPPHKFEAGTPNIAGAVGFDAAMKYVSSIGVDNIQTHEQNLLDAATEGLRAIDGLRIVGESPRKVAVVSFLLGEAHPYDVGTILNQQGVAVRTGHHCTMPLMEKLEIPGTVRASFAVYNNLDDVHRLVDAVKTAKRFLL